MVILYVSGLLSFTLHKSMLQLSLWHLSKFFQGKFIVEGSHLLGSSTTLFIAFRESWITSFVSCAVVGTHIISLKLAESLLKVWQWWDFGHFSDLTLIINQIVQFCNFTSILWVSDFLIVESFDFFKPRVTFMLSIILFWLIQLINFSFLYQLTLNIMTLWRVITVTEGNFLINTCLTTNCFLV